MKNQEDMRRRSFLKISGMAAVAVGAVSCKVSEQNTRRTNSKLGVSLPSSNNAGADANAIVEGSTEEENLLQAAYTADNPGPFAGKEAGHLPQVEGLAFGIKVTTNHEMTQEHFISYHAIFDGNGDLLSQRILDPSTDAEAITIFSVPRPSTETFTIISTCNLHKTWKATYKTIDFKASFGTSTQLYTSDHPGGYASKSTSHLPTVSVVASRLRIETPHEMTPDHHITKHQVLDGRGRILAEVKFDPEKDTTAESILNVALPSTEVFYAVSEYNLHEVWLSEYLTKDFIDGFSTGNQIYTTATPGKWSGKEGSHAPVAEIMQGLIKVSTAHGMAAEHYISRHQLVDGRGQILAESNLVPGEGNQAVSIFNVGLPNTPNFFVVSECNLHDVWTTEYQTKDFVTGFSLGSNIYTPNDEGRWSGKGGSHTPSITIAGTSVTVAVNHGMTAEHYISRAQLRDQFSRVLAEKVFDPTVDMTTEITFTLNLENVTSITALAECNLHDVWISPETIV